jgi:MFS family permease
MRALLWTRRFGPLFATQMLGAVNDNFFKNALVVLVLFRGSGRVSLVLLAGGIFILPYALFSATAGALADRMDKARLIRLTKLFEIGLMALATFGFLTREEGFLLLVLFGLGVQATFFGPLKYGILPELLAPDELLVGNALVEASTFVGILLGTVCGGLLILLDNGRAVVSAAAVLLAVCGWLCARQVPSTGAAAPGLQLRANIGRETWRLLGEARSNRAVWACILLLSWFWALGAAFLAEFPVIVKQNFGAGGEVVTLMLAVFSIGIGLGSLLAGRLLHGEVAAGPVAPAAALMTLFALDFAWTAGGVHPIDGWVTIHAILNRAGGWRAMADLLGLAVCGGVFSVPLYALLQQRAPAAWRARMVAANNVMNAVAMVAGAVVLEAGTQAGWSARGLLVLFGLGNGVVAIVTAVKFRQGQGSGLDPLGAAPPDPHS